MSANIPPDVKHAKTHEWIRVRDAVATVGISDHAQHELTDVVFVELPAVGRQLQAGAACAVVESVKTASDIYSPVSGEVTAVNQELVAASGTRQSRSLRRRLVLPGQTLPPRRTGRPCSPLPIMPGQSGPDLSYGATAWKKLAAPGAGTVMVRTGTCRNSWRRGSS